MTYQPSDLEHDRMSLLKPPAWVTQGRAESSRIVAFRSGAVLSALDRVLQDPVVGVPKPLLANYLALRTAAATSKIEGRLSRLEDIRDAFHLTPAGDDLGPDGSMLTFWRSVSSLDPVRLPSPEKLGSVFGAEWAGLVGPTLQIADARCSELGPISGCALAFQHVLKIDDRSERVAMALSDLVLARSIGWDRVYPVSALHLSKSQLQDLVSSGQGAELAVERSLLQSLTDVCGYATSLAANASRIRAVAPKLRAKSSDAVVAVFLREDAVGPSIHLSPTVKGSAVTMTSRAARRICDRLVDLGVAHELTGRSTFRLYGVAP